VNRNDGIKVKTAGQTADEKKSAVKTAMAIVFNWRFDHGGSRDSLPYRHGGVCRLLTAFFIGSASAVSGQAVWAFEHPRYAIEAEVQVSQKRIVAHQATTLTNHSPQTLGDVYFHLYANRRYTKKEQDFLWRYSAYFKVNPFPDGFPQTGMTMRGVSLDGVPLSFSIEGKDQTLLRVVLPEGQSLPPGKSLTLTMDYTVDIPHAFGRFGWHESVIKGSHFYPVLAVQENDGWNQNPFYPFHRPFYSEAAHYAVVLTVPRDQVVIHSGLLAEEAMAQEGKKRLVIQSDQPIREFAFAMSPDYHLVEEQYGAVTIRSYFFSGDRSRAEEALKIVKGMMAFYTEWFGPYPYRQFSIAPVFLGYGGEQMSNMIFIDTRAYRLPGALSRYFDFLVAHETGHQWMYNLVGVNEYAQMWLEEGLVSYFLLEYLEGKYGSNAEIMDFPAWFKDWEWVFPDLTFRKARDFRYRTVVRIGYDQPVISRLSSFREPSTIFSLTYGKGSRIVAMLKEVMGETAFREVFQRIYRDYQYRNLSLDDFIRLCEEVSRQDLSRFFAQWLYGQGVLDYAVSGVRPGAVIMANRGDLVMPVEVEVTFLDGQSATVMWNAQAKEERLRLDNPNPIVKVRVDPEDKLLDIDRTNNHWPRKMDIRPVPIYWGLYDLPVFMRDDAYNLILGPELADSGLGVKAALHKPYDQTLYAATDYELGENLHHSRFGYQLHNLLKTQTTLGWELANTTDYNGGEDDVVSGRMYLRRELWPAQYGLGAINDHVSLYLLRNRGLNQGTEVIASGEDDRQLDYSRRNESIIGAAFHLDRSAPYPDPRQGFRFALAGENAGHFLRATQYFYRTSADLSLYQPVTALSKLAFRVKGGWGYPDDKELFRLGGMDGLRGYNRKDVRGANVFLGSVEYRFPILKDINRNFLDHLLSFEGVDGVVFFDAGQAWFGDFADSRLRKDAGGGMRLSVNIGSFLEKVIIRADVAQAVHDSGEDPRFWFGVNHAF
jgi:hypothetical protein